MAQSQERIQDKIDSYQYVNCIKKSEHKKCPLEFVCIDQNCHNQFLEPLCKQCIQENVHSEILHKTKDLRSVLKELGTQIETQLYNAKNVRNLELKQILESIAVEYKRLSSKLLQISQNIMGMAKQLFSGLTVDLNLILTEELIDSILDNQEDPVKLQEGLLRIGKITYERDNRLFVFKQEKSVQNQVKQQYVSKMRNSFNELNKLIKALENDSSNLSKEINPSQETDSEKLLINKEISLPTLNHFKSPKEKKVLKVKETKQIAKKSPIQSSHQTKYKLDQQQIERIAAKKQVSQDILQQEIYQYEFQLEALTHQIADLQSEIESQKNAKVQYKDVMEIDKQKKKFMSQSNLIINQYKRNAEMYKQQLSKERLKFYGRPQHQDIINSVEKLLVEEKMQFEQSIQHELDSKIDNLNMQHSQLVDRELKTLQEKVDRLNQLNQRKAEITQKVANFKEQLNNLHQHLIKTNY